MRAAQLIRLAILFSVLVGLSGCAGTGAPLNKHEWDHWYGGNASNVRWVGYQGSDAHFHYFIARVKAWDEWRFIMLKRSEVTVEDERRYSSLWTGPVYYYLVDPAKNYTKIASGR